MENHKCDFLPEVVEALGAQDEDWDRDDLILRIAQLKEYGAQFERAASLLGVDLENQLPEAVLERIQAFLPPPKVASESGLSFGQALEHLKAGRRVCRTGWNGKSMWLALTPAKTVKWAVEYDGADLIPHHSLDGAARQYVLTEGVQVLNIAAHICMRAADGTLVPGWLASQTDMLASDWMVLPLAAGELQ